jgi:hypothetical protein
VGFRASALFLICTAELASAQSRPILHEDIPSPRAGDASREAGRQNPSAIRQDGKLIPEPTSSAVDSTIVYGRETFGGDRETEWQPDNMTGGGERLRYVQVFNPSVIPYKRSNVFNAVDASGKLVTVTGERRLVPVGAKPSQVDDLFWGALTIALEPGKDTPIPSVGPNMRIVSYETTPRVALEFSKDAADNFSVRASGSARGAHQLVFLVAGEKSYFSPKLPPSVGLAQIELGARRKLGAAWQPLPDEMAPSARRAAQSLSIRRDTPLPRAMRILVGYFRGFEPKPPPAASGNLYWDLFQSKAGVCRHRAYAFMITGLGLGIPTRYVENEAHAFIEVWSPESGWGRIDLGGAALEFSVENAEGKTLHTPPADPFPKPESFRENYTQWGGNLRGLSESQLEEARDGTGTGAATATEAGAETGGHGPEAAPDASKKPLTLRVTRASGEGFRGESIEVEGTLKDAAGNSVSGLAIDVWLSKSGSGDDAISIGRTATRGDGTFRARFSIPASVELRAYEVLASTPGNDQFQSAISP